MNHARRTGMMAALSTYLIWGILPLYWNLLARAEANEILAHRIVWSFFFMVIVLIVTKRWQSFKEDCRTLWADKKRGAILLMAAFVISLNWLTYIWAVNHDHVIDTSIGYYINPLMSVLFGIVFFRERISGLKKISLLLAAIGIVLMTYQLGKLPWVAVVLAVSFSVYGALKKQLHLNPFSSITLETMLMMPFAVPYIGILMASPVNHFSLATPDLALFLMGTGRGDGGAARAVLVRGESPATQCARFLPVHQSDDWIAARDFLLPRVVRDGADQRARFRLGGNCVVYGGGEFAGEMSLAKRSGQESACLTLRAAG